MNDDIRFIDLLSTAATVAGYQGAEEVTAEHLALAADILRGQRSFDEAGTPVPPFVGTGDPFASIAPALRELIHDWYLRLGADTDAVLDDAALDIFLAEARAREHETRRAS
jgi:hypothetical protein